MASITECIKTYFPNQTIEGQSTHLPLWKRWYEGYDDEFHRYYIYNGVDKVWKERKKLKMGKKASEDWANLLLNEKFVVTIPDNDKLDVILRANDFWYRGNQLVDKSFGLSMGAFVESVVDATITEDGSVVKSSNAKIKIDYLSALKIYPVTFRNGELVECAFVRENTNSTRFTLRSVCYSPSKNPASTDVILVTYHLKMSAGQE